MVPVVEIEVHGLLTAERRAALAGAFAGAEGAVLLDIASDGLPFGEMADPVAVAEIAALCAAVAAGGQSVAVLTGPVRGAALELALAATGRVAGAGADLGFDDLSLGLVPGAGGTQRLPRLVGAADALRLLLTGARLSAVEALVAGLVDRVVETDAVAAGRVYAAAGDFPERRGFRDGRGYLAAVSAARKDRLIGAEARAVDCVEMALLLPLAQGLAFEHTCFRDLCGSEVSLGLRHAGAVLAHVAGEAAALPARIGIWGGGPVAVEVALAALDAGLAVQLAAPDREAVVSVLADVAERQQARVAAGAVTAERRDADWARLLPQVGPEGVAGVGLTVMTAQGSIGGPKVMVGIAPQAAGTAWISRFDRLAEVMANGAAGQDVALALGVARLTGHVPVLRETGQPIALSLAAALSDAVLWAEAQGLERAAIARSLAAQGIAGDGDGEAGAAADAVALRCLAALANAGARMIAAGDAPDAGYIDAVAVAGGLMARWTGGPMHCANRRGLLVLRRDLRLWGADDPALWSPAPLIDALVAEGRGFS